MKKLILSILGTTGIIGTMIIFIWNLFWPLPVAQYVATLVVFLVMFSVYAIISRDEQTLQANISNAFCAVMNLLFIADAFHFLPKFVFSSILDVLAGINIIMWGWLFWQARTRKASE